jgi:microcystin-dependent protein
VAFFGEIMMFAGSTPPGGFLICDGSTIPIAGNEQLFAAIGTQYGGDGVTTFRLPDIRSRVVLGFQQGGGQSLGYMDGYESVTVSVPQLPAHSHDAGITAATHTSANPSGNVLASNGAAIYVNLAPNVSLESVVIASAGSGVPHSNIQPYLVVNFCICASGGGAPV